MMHRSSVGDDEIASRHLHAAMIHGRQICVGEKTDYLASRLHRSKGDLRQAFVSMLHPELVQADLGQLGAKGSPPSRKHLHIRCANCSLIREWVGKGEELAPSHSPSFQALG